MNGNGDEKVEARITAPRNDLTRNSASALVKGRLFIFGGNRGDFKKVLFFSFSQKCPNSDRRSRKLRNQRASGQTQRGASTWPRGAFDGFRRKRFFIFRFWILIYFSALVCFGSPSDDSCEEFNGEKSIPTFSTSDRHRHGGLGFYRGQPATVGNYDPNHGKAETLSSSGWSSLPTFPK